MADSNQQAADKLDKETKKAQEKQQSEFDKPRKNMPTENDMGPLPIPKAVPVKKMAKGGMTASKRADGIAVKGKTKGRMV
jgi:hypothetical protein